jgi:hypothetical protein
MLNCVYHPVDEMRVVDDEERQRLLATGYWFDHPNAAKQKRETYEKRLLDEQKPRQRKKRKDAEQIAS